MLLDAHSLIWAFDAPERLSPAASQAIEDGENQLQVSAATIWEIAIKCGKGKLRLSRPFLEWIRQAIVEFEISTLDITPVHAARQIVLRRPTAIHSTASWPHNLWKKTSRSSALTRFSMPTAWLASGDPASFSVPS
jgi:PIN domain nuclease of toxin-antitoxin system